MHAATQSEAVSSDVNGDVSDVAGHDHCATTSHLHLQSQHVS